MKKFSIALPWPPYSLNPNNTKAHWRIKHSDKQSAKHDANILMLKAIGESGFDRSLIGKRIKVTYLFCPPEDNKTRDLDNLLSSMKAAQDGIALALDIDDSRIGPILIDWARYYDYEIALGAVLVILEPPTKEQQ